MPLFLWIITMAPLLLAAWAAGRAADPRRARRLGLAGAVAAMATTLLAYVCDVLGWQGGGLLTGVPAWAGMPAYVSLVGLIAVGLSPVSGLHPGTVGRILQVTALSLLAVGVGHPVAMISLTAVTMVPVWQELGARVETQASARVFGWYLVPSAVMMLAGGVLYQLDMTAVALPMLGLGILIRAALVPCHSWLPDVVEQAPTGIVVVLIAPQLGVYALLRLLSLGLMPVTGWLLVGLGAATAVYGAALGVGRCRSRRSLGYLVMSQGGLVVLGLAHTARVAWTGTLLTAMVVGLASAGFILAMAALEARRGTPVAEPLPDSVTRIPRLAPAFLGLGMAGVGLPGLLGFVARDEVFRGTLGDWPLLGVALVLATALNAVTVVRSVRGPQGLSQHGE
jgi:NADH-quinone oxidoreductase subunit M